MKHRSEADWLRECPYHVIIENSDEEALDWLMEKGPAPEDWHLAVKIPKSTIGRPGKASLIDIYAFRHKKDAVLFKLMWWKPSDV